MRPTWDFSLGVNAKGVQLPKGALAGQKVELFFADLVKGADGVRNFDDLPIPFRAVATDLEDGGMKVFDSGPLPEVMRASMSVPGSSRRWRSTIASTWTGAWCAICRLTWRARWG